MRGLLFLWLVGGLAISPTTTQDSSDSSCNCTFEFSQISGRAMMWVDAKRLQGRYFFIPELQYVTWPMESEEYNVQVDWNQQRALLTPDSSIVDSYPEYLHDMENGTMYEKHPNGTCVFYDVPQEANIAHCLPNNVIETYRAPDYVSFEQLDNKLFYRPGDPLRIQFLMTVGLICTPITFVSIRLLPNRNGLQIYQAITIETYNIPNVEKTLYPNYKNCKKTTWRLP